MRNSSGDCGVDEGDLGWQDVGLAIYEADNSVDFAGRFESCGELLDGGVVGFGDFDPGESLLRLFRVAGEDCDFKACFEEVCDDCWAKGAIWLTEKISCLYGRRCPREWRTPETTTC